MSTPTCVRCDRPMADGAYACPAETAKAAEQLRNLADMVPAARDIAHGLSRRGGGGTSGKPGSRLPLDLMATQKLDGVSNTLTGWARHVSEVRGVELPEPPVELLDPMNGPLCRTRYECTHDSCKIMRDGDEWGWDMIVVAAQFQGQHMEWWRHRPECDEFLRDVEACERVIRGLARGPSEQRFLGLCGAQVEAGDPACPAGCSCRTTDRTTTAPVCDGCLCLTRCHNEFAWSGECQGDVYAREGASEGRCRTCGTKWPTAERRAWLDGEVRQYAYTAAEIADAYPIKANTIRQWLSRGLLVPHGEIDGKPLLNLGEVLDLAAGDAARREEARATRARRAAVKADNEGAAA